MGPSSAFRAWPILLRSIDALHQVRVVVAGEELLIGENPQLELAILIDALDHELAQGAWTRRR